MKLKQVIDIAAALSSITTAKLPAKASYRVAKAINLLRPEVTTFEEQRIKLAAELGTLSEDRMSYTFDGDSAAKFQAQLNELLEEECNVVIPTVAPDDLGTAEIEPQHLIALDGAFIKEIGNEAQ